MIYPKKYRPIRKIINNDLYLIFAEIPTGNVKNIQDVKQYLGCDVAIRDNTNNIYIFCEKIEEVDYEEI